MNVKPTRIWKRWALVVGLLVGLGILVANRPWWAWYPHRQADARLAAHRLGDASWWIEIAERVGGKNSETTLYRAKLARKAGDTGQAAEYLHQAEMQGLAADRVVREQILIGAQSGDVLDAPRLLPILLQGSPRDAPDVCEAFAIGFYTSHTAMETAIQVLNAWVVDYPDDPRPHVLLAQLSLEVLDMDNAMLELRRALDVDPGHGPAALELGKLKFKQQLLDEALQLFQTAAHYQALQPEALAWQARCLRTVGRYAEAQSRITPSLQAEPEAALGNVEQAHLEIAADDYLSAIRRLRAVLDREPFRHEARRVLATALRATGESEAAKAQLEIVAVADAALVRARHLARDVVLDDDNVALRAEIGEIYLEHGDPQIARQWLRSVLMFDPHHQPTQRILDGMREDEA